MPDEEIKTQRPGSINSPVFCVFSTLMADFYGLMRIVYELTMTVWYPALFRRLSIAAASSSVGKVPTVTR